MIRTGKQKGFTLIELLVVISIIALLLSILMPSLQKAREQARQIVCGNNVKQIALSEILYSQSNDDYLPPTVGFGQGFYLCQANGDRAFGPGLLVVQGYIKPEMLYNPSYKADRTFRTWGYDNNFYKWSKAPKTDPATGVTESLSIYIDYTFWSMTNYVLHLL